MKRLPTIEILRERFSYDPDTGEVWNKLQGRRAGKVTKQGYRTIKIDDSQYQEHRIIWMLVTGADPEDKVIDHINRIGTDNRWCNLRICSQAQNKMNASGRGIYKDKRRGIWVAKIRHKGHLHHIGADKCPLIARVMFEEASRLHRGEYSGC